MCGIVGILGNHEASPILVDALKRLEYRGYDSSGIATISDGVLERRRETGKLVNLADKLVHHPLKGKLALDTPDGQHMAALLLLTLTHKRLAKLQSFIME